MSAGERRARALCTSRRSLRSAASSRQARMLAIRSASYSCTRTASLCLSQEEARGGRAGGAERGCACWCAALCEVERRGQSVSGGDEKRARTTDTAWRGRSDTHLLLPFITFSPSFLPSVDRPYMARYSPRFIGAGSWVLARAAAGRSLEIVNYEGRAKKGAGAIIR